MKKIGRILSLIVCFQLAWGCNSNEAVTTGSSSSGPASGYTQLSGSVTLAFQKVTEALIPSAAAQNSFSAADMVANLPADCADAPKAAPSDKSKKVAHLIDYSDLNNPCRIKKIELNVAANGQSATYNVEIENSLVEDKVVALVYGDESNEIYKSSIFSIDKGVRVIKQHLNRETSVKAEILGKQLSGSYSGVEFTDDVKSEMKKRLKELKLLEDFGLDLIGDKEKMLTLLNDPKVKDGIIDSLILARDAKESEGEIDPNRLGDAYINFVTSAEAAAVDTSVEVKDFISMKCTPDHIFVAKYGNKEYILQFASTNAKALEGVASRWGASVSNGRFYFDPESDVRSLNGHIGKLFWVVREVMEEMNEKIPFKIIISDVAKKEADRSCSVTIAPPSLDFAALQNFNYKAYSSYNEAIIGLEALYDGLFETLSSKFLLNGGEISDVESESYHLQAVKADGIVSALKVKILAYFKLYYFNAGLGIDFAKLSAFNYKLYKTPAESQQALSDFWSTLLKSFEEKISKKLEANEITKEEYSELRDFQIGTGKGIIESLNSAIVLYFHGLYLAKEFGVDITPLVNFDFATFPTLDDALKGFDSTKSRAQDDYKQMLSARLAANEITQSDFDIIFENEIEFLESTYNKIRDAIISAQ